MNRRKLPEAPAQIPTLRHANRCNRWCDAEWRDAFYSVCSLVISTFGRLLGKDSRGIWSRSVWMSETEGAGFRRSQGSKILVGRVRGGELPFPGIAGILHSRLWSSPKERAGRTAVG